MSSPAEASYHCSRLSPYFSTGCLSIRSALWKTNQRKAALKDSKISNKSKSSWAKSLSSFQSRLAWHCHFIQKLEQEPTLDLIAMNVDLDSRMEREYDETTFRAWASGNTGWPFFDACMRQLISTGWINFRMRAMIMSVSSYTLWLPWRIPAYTWRGFSWTTSLAYTGPKSACNRNNRNQLNPSLLCP